MPAEDADSSPDKQREDRKQREDLEAWLRTGPNYQEEHRPSPSPLRGPSPDYRDSYYRDSYYRDQQDNYRDKPSRPRRWERIVLLVVVALGIALIVLMLAGCGSTDSHDASREHVHALGIEPLTSDGP